MQEVLKAIRRADFDHPQTVVEGEVCVHEFRPSLYWIA